ncbi:MAG: hypothetical protein ISS36_03460 [Candidatus Aenigmarchaeota archaeon]|nr:hypothetical protein [Candidatus Aenigmarchaeota archaeon]
MPSDDVYLPEQRMPEIRGREYKLYMKSEERKLSWYEKLAKLASKFIKMNPDQSTNENLGKAISFADLRITPTDVMSLFVSTIVLFIIVGVVTGVTGVVPLMAGVLIAALGLGIGYYFLKYPINLVKKRRIEASSEVVLAILYMVVSMRISPNLERALRFAAVNISGALAWDMRKLIWDIEMGKYTSAEQAIDDYMVKWKSENEEFSEALRLIKESLRQIPTRAETILDESLTVILEGSKTRMKHYSQELMLPVMVIHMMGIVLPVLGTIMAPLAAVFMADLVRPEYFIIGYDIVLPIVIIWFINNTLNKRPMTFSQVDISKHPDLPKGNSFRLKGIDIPVLPVAIIITAAFLISPIMFFAQNPDILATGIVEQDRHTFYSMLMSIMVIIGIGVGISVYYILSNFQKKIIYDKIQKMEGEFELALFQLGNKIAGGTPTEVAIEKSIDDVKDLEIVGLFKKSLDNIRNLGMTFEQSIFDEEYGAIRYYPSKLIKNIMYAVIDTAKKGVTYASESMLRIAKYLKNVRETQEYLRDILSDTVSSMSFQAYFLSPIITGLIVSMADVIIKVLSKLGAYLEGMGLEEAGMGGGMGLSNIFGNMESSISPELFQMIVGIYLIEVIIILSMFVTKINHGENKILQKNSIGRTLIIALIIYALVALVAGSLFGDMIESALSGMGIIA